MTKEEILEKHANAEKPTCFFPPHTYDGNVDPIYAAMSEYAKSQAKSFAKWIAEEEFEMLYAAKVWESVNFKDQYSTEELYNLFLQAQQP